LAEKTIYSSAPSAAGAYPIRAFNFDAVGFNIGIVLERMMHDAPGQTRSSVPKLHHVAPPATFFGGVRGFFTSASRAWAR